MSRLVLGSSPHPSYTLYTSGYMDTHIQSGSNPHPPQQPRRTIDTRFEPTPFSPFFQFSFFDRVATRSSPSSRFHHFPVRIPLAATRPSLSSATRSSDFSFPSEDSPLAAARPQFSRPILGLFSRFVLATAARLGGRPVFGRFRAGFAGGPATAAPSPSRAGLQ